MIAAAIFSTICGISLLIVCSWLAMSRAHRKRVAEMDREWANGGCGGFAGDPRATIVVTPPLSVAQQRDLLAALADWHHRNK
ncbi:hypothetical protein NHU_02279 [Rhodovulum sulfidophilum]|uniref:Uncharacterized protein n=1 Tax=Rhodovulum sulfidophilum TaxID=35806 RepID=A0A0D6B320_RHOSU|nr:hypothetical protein [Rhodovulum sulfidophilum]BAQ69431.1 hypothetical protein NHU_02279 [Rhodovulum sulfidophilum]